MISLKLTKYLTLALTALVAAAATAREAADWFVSAPAEVISGIPRNTRLDALDYFRSGIERDVSASENITVRITELTPQTVTFTRGEGKTLQIATLPAGRDTLLAVVTTVTEPLGVSAIGFFNSDWSRAEKGSFRMPEFSQWLTSEADASLVQATLGFIPATARFNGRADSLLVTNTGLANARLNGVDSLLKPELRFEVTKAKFRPVK